MGAEQEAPTSPESHPFEPDEKYPDVCKWDGRTFDDWPHPDYDPREWGEVDDAD